MAENMTIENNVAIWHMRMEGEISGTYVGTFKFRCFLTPTQRIAANREYRELLGNNPALAPEHESFLAYALTQLKHRIVEAPPFWDTKTSSFAGDIPDDNVISAILEAAVSAEVKYREQLKKRKEEAVEKAKELAEKLVEQREEAKDES